MCTVELKFTRPHSGMVVFGAIAVKEMEKYKQCSPMSTEAGGMLLGRLIEESEDVLVDEVTPPTSKDRRERFFFWRSKKPAQRIVNAAWERSQHSLNYFGEWHTHPDDHPSPSSTDIANWKRISHEAKYESAFLLFAIVGRICIKVWEVQKGGGEPVELKLATT